MSVVVKENEEKTKESIPDFLVYEVINGKPIAYRDYKKVILGEKSLEEIMGSSLLQSWLVAEILHFIRVRLNTKKYLIVTNEAGLKSKENSYRSGDIAIFSKEMIQEQLFSNGYAKNPPRIVIEVDTKANLEDYENPLDYFYEKTEELLNWGVEKVIWIFTTSRKVMFSEKNKPWITFSWNQDIEVIDSIVINLESLVNEVKSI